MSKKLKKGQEVIYVSSDPNNILLKGKTFKVFSIRLFPDGTENYNLMSEEGYFIKGVCNISQHIKLPEDLKQIK